jgi:hypothetical protein
VKPSKLRFPHANWGPFSAKIGSGIFQNYFHVGFSLKSSLFSASLSAPTQPSPLRGGGRGRGIFSSFVVPAWGGHEGLIRKKDSIPGFEAPMVGANNYSPYGNPRPLGPGWSGLGEEFFSKPVNSYTCPTGLLSFQDREPSFFIQPLVDPAYSLKERV